MSEEAEASEETGGEGAPKRDWMAEAVRIAMVCPKCHRRAFGDPKWRCDEHGKAERQANRPYFGKDTTKGRASVTRGVGGGGANPREDESKSE